MHVLYLSHTGMSEPLGQSQVLAYLRGLARRGHTFDLVSFEPAGANDAALAELAHGLSQLGIDHHPLRRSAAHDLRTKAREAGTALTRSLALALRRRPALVHARSTLPAAVALTLARATGAKMLFDCRGLLGEEYVDAGHWRREDLKYKLTTRVEDRLFRSADAVVTLTSSLRDLLRREHRLPATTDSEVIPCCVDVERFRRSDEARAATRARLGAGSRLVVVYAGTLGSWYCEEEMASLYARIRALRPAQFLVLTRSDSGRLKRALANVGVPGDEIHVESATPAQMPAALAGGDVGLSLISASPSKIASSPTKVAEYLAAGLRVVMNRGVGDAAAMLDAEPGFVDAGDLSPAALDIAAGRAVPLDPMEGLALARRWFDLDEVGVGRYASLYERIGRSRRAPQ